MLEIYPAYIYINIFLKSFYKYRNVAVHPGSVHRYVYICQKMSYCFPNITKLLIIFTKDAKPRFFSFLYIH